MLRVIRDRATQCVEIVIREALAENVRQRAKDRPIFARVAGRKRCAARALNTALEIDVEPVLFRIGSAGKNDIGTMSSGVAVAALIDDEGPTQTRDVELVGSKKKHEIDIALLRAVDNSGGVAPVLARHESEIERADARRCGVQNVEAVPAAFQRSSCGSDHSGFGGDLGSEFQNGCTVLARDR